MSGYKFYNTIQYNTIQYNTIQYNTIQIIFAFFLFSLIGVLLPNHFYILY